MSEQAESIAHLPAGAAPPLRVWINGVEQHEGSDFVQRGSDLVFEKPLEKEGRLGPWRWTLMLLGIAGTYRKNDSVDVQYEINGRTKLATGVELTPVKPSG